MQFEFEAELWEATAEGAWVFVSLPVAVADEIDESVPAKAGFGSVKVQARIGDTTWGTSVFPDKKRQTFILPVKKQVRRAEQVGIGDVVSIRLRIAVD